MCLIKIILNFVKTSKDEKLNLIEFLWFCMFTGIYGAFAHRHHFEKEFQDILVVETRNDTETSDKSRNEIGTTTNNYFLASISDLNAKLHFSVRIFLFDKYWTFEM